MDCAWCEIERSSRRRLEPAERRVCPACDHVFRGSGWDGIDAHWKAKHEQDGTPYEKLWAGLMACPRHHPAQHYRTVLLTAVVSSGSKSYTTQLRVASWGEAVAALLAAQNFREFSSAVLPSVGNSPLKEDEVALFIPMDGLVNAWLMQGGRSGDYFSAILVGTEEGDDGV